MIKQGTKIRRYPTKKGINLARKEIPAKDIRTLVIGVCLIIVLSAAVVKFAVLDQYGRLSEAEASYNQVHREYLELLEKQERYPQVQAEYRAHSLDWMADADSGLFVSVDRQEVLDLAEQILMRQGTVQSIGVWGDVVEFSMSGMNLQEISVMFEELQKSPIVGSVTLNLAQTDQEEQSDDVSFSITIILKAETEDV